MEHYDFDYFLRLDDDGDLCVENLLWEIRTRAPATNFFWGKYFCSQDKVVADENFMLFSGNLIQLFLHMKPALKTGPPSATFAALFGMWQHFLNLTIWDDRLRIDAQQGYTTKFMHVRKYDNNDNNSAVSKEDLSSFCMHHVWAHHVKSPQLIRDVFLHQDHSSVRLNNSSVKEKNNSRTTTSLEDDQPWKKVNITPNAICQGENLAASTKWLDPEKTSAKGGHFPALMMY